MISFDYNDKKYFKFYPYCKISIGVFRSIIINTKEKTILNYDSKINDLFSMLFNNTVGEIGLKYVDNEELIRGLFESLISRQLGFYTFKPNLFPELSISYFEPRKISNIIIEVSNFIAEFMQEVINDIELLEVESVELRIVDDLEISSVFTILDLILRSTIISIDIYLPSSSDLSDKLIIQRICNDIPKVTNIIIYDSQFDHLQYIGDVKVYQLESGRDLRKECGNVQLDNFNGNFKFYTESLNHNSCLNRKISLTFNGDIKSCPSMSCSYGNIINTTLLEAIEKPDFKKYWGINKDLIHVCKDCEFRYICTDCRAYVEDPDDLFSKPLKCGYNPYIGEWSEWSTNPLKQKAIQYYGMEELVAERQERIKNEGREEGSGVENS